MTALTHLGLVHPVSRRPLWSDTTHSLTDGTDRFPVVAGIAYLRCERSALSERVLTALDTGDGTQALILLLQDQDGWAPDAPPTADAVRKILTDKPSFRDAMRLLNFGPVADYFAHRWSAPTFLSALGLIGAYAPLNRPLVDLACGTGQVLREFALRGGEAIGVDQVFAKLWLGRRYLGLTDLICADAESLPLAESTESRSVLCHDALYFLNDAAKIAAIARMQDAAGPQGVVLLGHCHLKDHAHAGMRAHPLSLADWQALLPGATCYDDAALTWRFVSRGAVPLTPHEGGLVAAITLARGAALSDPVPFWDPVGTLTPNPLLVPHDAGLRPCWPSPDFAREYADATYLCVDDAAAAQIQPEAVRFAQRTLLPLPETW
ncbi:MAG: class I SAM-dependent methyltransferase [Candidatus Competibacteraceae bacterium]|nr:class I SAM-dependent methyltransferase [Candidatus Competibacteraceae bacterium]